MQEFEKQYLKQAFAEKCRKGGHLGTITSVQFSEIVKTLLAHKLSAYTVENVTSVSFVDLLPLLFTRDYCFSLQFALNLYNFIS